MDFLEACLHANGRAAVKSVKSMIPAVRTSAIWAIIMHGAAWHEERSFDTSHATILVYAVHRLIESLGSHSSLVDDNPVIQPAIDISEDNRILLQELLLEHLVISFFPFRLPLLGTQSCQVNGTFVSHLMRWS